ncbi:hypothetical protein LTR10_014877 [Elasticomyces elasticus]|uniref:Uncharacterized protein n=1 Tax=Exophiala sideris TaxID=1016849 RepID=A0ABR0JFQ8_9EURO|nr:hypothetical protein LTR10_014877 [Elasticomyces elasticus]KAK5025721.1 hypothetical protein LTS07_007925 [Exophiala sideris]KAK5033070.1 hypothetical protein LTR13_007035 [Exophiala sideris]KAK5063555.1 hypothetical protein LTR69_004261 [Exophiala sideris]KAK5180612.1 hypothetical protein LTR44_006926 [Eurotiomycetes sp. CCFEE 6388]
MCYYKLDACPYPNKDLVAALIFLPAKAGDWEYCDKPKPWGRLSCGNLVVEHPKDLPKQPSTSLPEEILTTHPRNDPKIEQHGDNDVRARLRRSSTEGPIVTFVPCEAVREVATCRWCTAVIKLVGTKSKEIQDEARSEVARLEAAMDGDAKLRNLRRELKEKEEQLDILRHNAWKMAASLMDRKAPENENNSHTQG